MQGTNDRNVEEIARSILDRAVQTYNPSLIICCYSGGYDSMIATHLVMRWRTNVHVLTAAVDTLISADGWRNYVTDSAHAIGARHFVIADNPELDSWKRDVLERGFVYRRNQHLFYFYWLKQRVFRLLLAKYKTHKTDRVMFVTGVRRAESKERVNTPEVSQSGSAVYCNPLVYWSDEECWLYRQAHELPVNPFYDTFGNSGDCLCNWHNRISLQTVEQHAPKVYEVIKPLHDHCKAHHGYGYQGEPSRYTKQELAGQRPLFPDMDDMPNLCAGCERHEPTNAQMDEMMMQRLKW